MYYLLLPLAWVYDGVTSVRNFMYDHGILSSESYDLPVICVGNITVGGTGKTPHTEYLIRLLQENGYKVGVLSRGYKRKTKGYVLATSKSTAADIGDEPYQMKKKFPDVTIAVDADRREGIYNLITNAETTDIDVIILDDAYQHRRVKAGLNILLVDSNRPIDKDYLLPAGRLRESAGGSKRADIVMLTKLKEDVSEGERERYCKRLRIQEDQHLYFTGMKYGNLYNPKAEIPLGELDKYSILVVTGIANPKPMEDELSKYASFDAIHYGDHHDFSSQDYKQIESAYNALPDDKPRIIITTEKDMARLHQKQMPMWGSVYALPIEVKVLNDEEELFNNQIISYLNHVRKDSRNSCIPQRENDK